jgi:hypothetical protein
MAVLPSDTDSHKAVNPDCVSEPSEVNVIFKYPVVEEKLLPLPCVFDILCN